MTKEQILKSTGLTEDEFYKIFPTQKSYEDAYKKKLGGSTPNPYPQLPTANNFFQYGVPVGPTITRFGGSTPTVFPQAQNIDQFFSRAYSDTNNAYAMGGSYMEAFPQARNMVTKFPPTDYAMLQQGGTSQATPSFATTRLQNFIDKVRETAYNNLMKEVETPENKQSKKKGGVAKYPTGGELMDKAVANIFDFENRRGTAAGTSMNYPTTLDAQNDYYYGNNKDNIDYSTRYGFDIENELKDYPGLLQHAADISFNTNKDPREILLIAAGVIDMNDRASLQKDPDNPQYTAPDGTILTIDQLWNFNKDKVFNQYKDDPGAFTGAVGDYRSALYSRTNKKNFDQATFDSLKTPKEKDDYLKGLQVSDAYRNSWQPRAEEMNTFGQGFIPSNEYYTGNFQNEAFKDVPGYDPATGMVTSNNSTNDNKTQDNQSKDDQMTDQERFGFSWPFYPAGIEPIYGQDGKRKIRVNNFIENLSGIVNPFGRVGWAEARAFGDMRDEDKVRMASQALSPFGDLSDPENLKKIEEAGYNIGVNVGTRRALNPFNRLKKIEWNLSRGDMQRMAEEANNSGATIPISKTRPEMDLRTAPVISNQPLPATGLPTANPFNPTLNDVRGLGLPFSGKDANSMMADKYMKDLMSKMQSYNNANGLLPQAPTVGPSGSSTSAPVANSSFWDTNALMNGISQRGDKYFITLPDGTVMEDNSMDNLKRQIAKRAYDESWGKYMNNANPFMSGSPVNNAPAPASLLPPGFFQNMRGLMNNSQKWGGQKKKFITGGPFDENDYDGYEEPLRKKKFEKIAEAATNYKQKDPTTAKNQAGDDTIFKGGFKFDIKTFDPYASAKINAAASILDNFIQGNKEDEYLANINASQNAFPTVASSRGDYTFNNQVGSNFRPDRSIPVFDQGVSGFRTMNTNGVYQSKYGGEMENGDVYFLTPQTLKYLKGR